MEYIPYFYLSRHTLTGKQYAGSRYGKGANPVEFMSEFGYQTSSPIIHRIITEEGSKARYLKIVAYLRSSKKVNTVSAEIGRAHSQSYLAYTGEHHDKNTNTS